MKVPRVIANVESTDRAVYLTPDAVSGDQNPTHVNIAKRFVPHLVVLMSLESQQVLLLRDQVSHGRAATSATRRCRGLLTYGLCKLISLIIFNEEKIFRESFAAAIGLQKPVAPMREDFPDGQTFSLAVQDFQGILKQYEGALEDQIQSAVAGRQLPPGVVGLIPDGDRKIDWRWKGPVFEDGTEDILNSSIVVRNFRSSALTRSRPCVISSRQNRRREAQCSVVIHSGWLKPRNKALAHS